MPGPDPPVGDDPVICVGSPFTQKAVDPLAVIVLVRSVACIVIVIDALVLEQASLVVTLL